MLEGPVADDQLASSRHWATANSQEEGAFYAEAEEDEMVHVKRATSGGGADSVVYVLSPFLMSKHWCRAVLDEEVCVGWGGKGSMSY